MCHIIDYFFFKHLTVLMFLTYKLGVQVKKKKNERFNLLSTDWL